MNDLVIPDCRVDAARVGKKRLFEADVSEDLRKTAVEIGCCTTQHTVLDAIGIDEARQAPLWLRTGGLQTERGRGVGSLIGVQPDLAAAGDAVARHQLVPGGKREKA